MTPLAAWALSLAGLGLALVVALVAFVSRRLAEQHADQLAAAIVRNTAAAPATRKELSHR